MPNQELTTILLSVLLVWVTLEGEANYDAQSLWSATCATGKEQSPINVNTRTLDYCPKLNFRLKYESETVSFVGSGQNYKIVTSASSHVGINDQTDQGLPAIRLYKAKSYHFHTPSQHTVNGIQYDLQLHHFHVPLEESQGQNNSFTRNFVNFNTSSYNKSGLFASVVGYLFYANDGPNAIDLDFQVDENGTAQVNMLELLGFTSTQLFYNYRGSTTVPVCSQNVDWFVYRIPLPLKKSSFEKIKKSINNGKRNNRRIQPLNSRQVRVVGGTCSTYQQWK